MCLSFTGFLTSCIGRLPQVRTLFVSGLPMDVRLRELYLLFRGFEVHSLVLCWPLQPPCLGITPKVYFCQSVVDRPHQPTYWAKNFLASEFHQMLRMFYMCIQYMYMALIYIISILQFCCSWCVGKIRVTVMFWETKDA